MSKAEKVKPRDFIVLYGTGKSRFLPEGKKIKVHRVAGENLIKLGRASKEAPKPKDKK